MNHRTNRAELVIRLELAGSMPLSRRPERRRDATCLRRRRLTQSIRGPVELISTVIALLPASGCFPGSSFTTAAGLNLTASAGCDASMTSLGEPESFPRYWLYPWEETPPAS